MKRVVLCLFAAVAVVASRASDVPVRDGLILHLDAAAQAAARKRAQLPAVGNRQPVDLWLDTSGNNRLLSQPVPERRPVLVERDGAAFLRFDGQDDAMLWSAGGFDPLAEMTVFVLAAPATNTGKFVGLFATAAFGRNDYTSGINLDFGPDGTANLSVLNLESAGATGFRDMLVPGFFNASERPFGDFHVFTIRTKPGKGGAEVFLDGFKGGIRDRSTSKIALDQIVVGGRIYSNDPSQQPFVDGHVKGAIAAMLIYNRALSDPERQRVEEELQGRTVALNALLHGAHGHALETVKEAPLVQMLVPGFSVEELPLKLNNLNNVRYRHDGKLVALGYDGRVQLLADTDGDGLEDKAEFFWDQRTLRGPIGMALLPKNDPRGEGLFVASKGKVSLLLDSNRDGRADEEKVVATGWPEIIQNVDTIGLAVDPKDGSIYFGLGTANFADGYLIDRATGKSQYDLKNIRGTIQRLSADFSTQETICTGVRFTCALAFNKHGDLFASEQEGATWLPNGNPFDELLHIQRGKHYGFPPRHPKHLPGVRDEPAVIEYGPQHQSTVGMVFNEGVNGGKHFGPAHWEGDAIMCGESRGKIWRTRLARTPLGYVALNHLIASIPFLVVDACVSPDGDLVVACHSGPPDWGTGPAGIGRIFKIRYAGKTVPQPVHAWAAHADEFRIAFDRPLDPAEWANAKAGTRVEAGEHVRAADRFEVIRPGYQVVRDQMAAPRRWVPVLGVTLTEDRRTVVVRVPRQVKAEGYAITLPMPASWRSKSGLRQEPQIDVAVSLEGVVATAKGNDGQERTCVLPHPSFAASAELMSGSADHEAFFGIVRSPGATLSLRALVDTSNPFVPAVQPGSKLDWDMSKDGFASTRFAIWSDYGGDTDVTPGTGDGSFRSVALNGIKPSGQNSNGLYLAHGDLRQPLSTARVRVPWAEHTATGEPTGLEARTRSDVKGNWLAGRRVYFGDGGCATCHSIRGEGTAFGPDLSNLIHRDRDSVLQDIIAPGATINPDHPGTVVTLRNGTVHSGLVRKMEAKAVTLALPAGVTVSVDRADIQSIEPLKGSLMPSGIVDQLQAAQVEDLLTFLLVQPLEPAPISRTEPAPPPARPVAALTDLLGANPQPAQSLKPLKILLCAGPKDHGIDEHDYPLWLSRWARLLSLAENVIVTTNSGFPSERQLANADVAVFYNANPGWDAAKARTLDTFHQRGGGVVYLHYAVDGGKDPVAAAERIGLAFSLGSKFRHGELDLVFPPSKHPITRGFQTLRFIDETYWNMRGDTSRLNVLANSSEENALRPQLWALERDKSRIVGCIPGHYTWTFDDPLFRMLVLRSICWAAREENVDRFAELALVGARFNAEPPATKLAEK